MEKQDRVIRNCLSCGRTHKINMRLAYGKACNICNKQNHFARMCRNKFKKVNEVNRDTYTEIEHVSDNLHIDIIEHKSNESWYIDLCINGVESQFKVDTGAEANVIHVDKFNSHKLNDVKICVCNKLFDYNKKEIRTLRKCILTVKYKNKNCTTDFYVVEGERKSLISFATSVKLGLINNVDSINASNNNYKHVVQKFENVFKGIGKVGVPYKIEIADNATPVVHPIKKVPFALEKPFKKCLQELEKLQIIERAE